MKKHSLKLCLIVIMLGFAFPSVTLMPLTARNRSERKATKLSNPKASPEARSLFKELLAYQRQGKILSGQMWSPWGFDEVNIYTNLRGNTLQ